MLLFAPEYTRNLKKVIFLAGPIQDAELWHQRAIDYIQKKYKNYDILCPYNFERKEFIHLEQIEWETDYLKYASENGGILFWLANQNNETPGRTYAQTTRFELGEWIAKHSCDNNINISIGYDSKFHGIQYIKERILYDKLSISVSKTLEQAIDNLIKKIEENN